MQRRCIGEDRRDSQWGVWKRLKKVCRLWKFFFLVVVVLRLGFARFEKGFEARTCGCGYPGGVKKGFWFAREEGKGV